MRILANILIILVLALALGGGAWYYSEQLEKEYQSSVSLLFIQEQRPSLDPAATIRSAEKIAETFAQVVMTEDFLDQVLIAEPSLSGSLPASSSDKRELWQSIMSPQVNGSFLTLDVYHPDPVVAEKIVSSAALVLMTKTNQWHGGGGTVRVKIVDSPLTSQQPVRPNVLLNTILGAVAGFILGIAQFVYQYYFTKQREVFAIANQENSPVNKHKATDRVNSGMLAANREYSNYNERVFVEKLNLYNNNIKRPDSSSVNLDNSNETNSPWTAPLGATKQAAPIFSKPYNIESKNFI